MENKLENKRLAIITGGAQGIGAAIAKQFVDYNVNVVVTSRNYVFKKLNFLSDTVIQQQLDLTDLMSIKRFFDWLTDMGRPIHFLINNAGIGVFKSINDTSLEEWKAVLETNLTGSFLSLKHAYPLLQSADGARIVNIGSVSEMLGLENNAVYAASKLGLRALSRTINEEWKKDNIFCTHVVLGAVATEIWSERKEFSIDDMLHADDVAKLIVNSIIQTKNIRLDVLEILPKKGIL